MEKANIIIAEDENIIALDMQYILKKLGYNVSAIVASGEESIELASSLMPDLVLMDIKLKGKLDGISAGEHIYRHLNIPIIFISAYGEDRMLSKLNKLCAFKYIGKPFLERELGDTIAHILKMNERLPKTNLNYS